MFDLNAALGSQRNFVFLGEAGSGKSEIAVNMAIALAKHGKRPVHLFDLDMTKPLFRSRDLCQELTGEGISVHYQEQFMDAPTLVGGADRLLRDDDCYVVLDVGGDHIGARSIGGYAPLLNRPSTAACYVVNSFRPWSLDLEHIDQVLGQILGVSHIQLEQLRFLGNPNLGPETSARDIENGIQQLMDTVGTCAKIEGICVREDLYGSVKTDQPLFPIRLYLTYPWNTGAAV